MNSESIKVKAAVNAPDFLHDGKPATDLSFDNRGEPLKHFDTYRTKKVYPVSKRIRYFPRSRFIPCFVGGSMHYAFAHNGRHYLYANIRKNASSAFVNFLVEKLPRHIRHDARKMRSLNLKLAPKRHAQLNRHYCSIFVYRNPLERLVSLFNNKFVEDPDPYSQQSLNQNFEHITHTRFVDTTFSDFVRVYLQRYFRLFSGGWVLDPHVFPQADCLWPIHYSHVIRFEHLHEDLSLILGKETATRYFSRKVNSTSTRLYDDPSSDIPVSDLRHRFARTGELPSPQAYCDGEIQAIIRQLYAIDYELGSLIGATHQKAR